MISADASLRVTTCPAFAGMTENGIFRLFTSLSGLVAVGIATIEQNFIVIRINFKNIRIPPQESIGISTLLLWPHKYIS